MPRLMNILHSTSLVPRPVLKLSMLHAEKCEGLVSEVMQEMSVM